MPIEERFITFNLEEIYQAVSIGSIKENLDPLPKGALQAIEIEGEADVNHDSIFLKVKTESGAEETHKFERKFFALALVFFCQGSGIPLPASGQKTLKILPDKIIMKIELGG